MKTILFVALLVIALAASAYIWRDKIGKRQVSAATVARNPQELPERPAATQISEAVKRQCFEASRQAILKELKAPNTARFAADMSEVLIEPEQVGSYLLASYVDVQDGLGAFNRVKWQTLLDKDQKVAWMKFDDDEIEPLEVVFRRLKGLPPPQGEQPSAREGADRTEGANEERARLRMEEVSDPRNRGPFHAFAQKYITSELESQKHRNIKHSALPKKDDQYTACYWLGKDVWEATGVVQSNPPSSTRRLRQPWKISMAVSEDNQPEVLSYLLGKEEVGAPEVARSRAGVAPTESK